MIVQQSMSSVAAVYDRRPERRGIRAVGEVAGRICPVQAGRRPQGQASGRERVNAGVRASYFLAKPLIENHNVVQSCRPGLAAQRPTPGKLPHKIQPLISRDCGPREARIRITANSPTIQNSTLKIQNWFPHPQTNPRLASTFSHPKSTVDLGCEPLIRVENGLRSPLSPTCYRPISGPKIRESNRIQTVTDRKILSPTIVWWPPRSGPLTQLHHQSLFIVIFYFKGFQSYSKHFKGIQRLLPASFFYFYAAIANLH